MRVAMPKINRQTLGGFKLRVPSLDEQQFFVAEFEGLRIKFETASDKIVSSITRLKEYRSALIAAAVTGQIDVETYAGSGNTERRIDTLETEVNA